MDIPFFADVGGRPMSDHSRYISPFSTRYASPEMQFVFSEDNKFRTWRRLWIALARAEQKQGLPITDEQIAELEAHKDDINYDDAQRRERECRHDVMSHVYAYGLQCPKAQRHHPSGGHQLLRGRQHRHHHHAAGPGRSCAASCSTSCDLLARFRREVQGPARAGLHPFAARAADHRGQARHPVDQRAVHGL